MLYSVAWDQSVRSSQGNHHKGCLSASRVWKTCFLQGNVKLIRFSSMKISQNFEIFYLLSETELSFVACRYSEIETYTFFLKRKLLLALYN